jgi:hypothetical protein
MVALGGGGGGEEAQLLLLTSAVDGHEWYASCPSYASTQGKDPTAGLDAEAIRKIYPAMGRMLVVQSLVRNYTDWATPSL